MCYSYSKDIAKIPLQLCLIDHMSPDPRYFEQVRDLSIFALIFVWCIMDCFVIYGIVLIIGSVADIIVNVGFSHLMMLKASLQ